jgi:hypothetical protein
MNMAVLWSALIGAAVGAIPGLISSLVMLHLTRKSNQSLERVKTDLQQDVIQFTKWHEKRIEAIIAIYNAFCEYLNFLRRALYWNRTQGMNLDPMHDFREKIEREMLYLDDAMAQKVSQYQGELLVFWNTALKKLAEEGESARENIRRQLDVEIPAYLPRLQEGINQFLDPNFKGDDNTYRRLIANWLSNQTQQQSPQHAEREP